MKESTLPSPGVGSKSMHLRRIAAYTISALEASARGYPNNIHPAAAGLATFFTTCATAATELTKAIPTLVFGGAASSTTIAGTATNQTTLTKGGSAGAATYSSSDTSKATVNGTGLVTGVSPGQVTITVNVAANGSYRAATKSLLFTITA